MSTVLLLMGWPEAGKPTIIPEVGRGPPSLTVGCFCTDEVREHGKRLPCCHLRRLLTGKSSS